MSVEKRNGTDPLATAFGVFLGVVIVAALLIVYLRLVSRGQTLDRQPSLPWCAS